MDVKPVKTALIDVSKLHVRYIPVVTPVDLWKHDMRLVKSPHVELMKIFKKHGFDRNRICDSRYFKDRQHRYRIGLTKWKDDKIWEHIKVRYGIFKSIQRRGFSKEMCRKDPVKVISMPFWTTRFGIELPWLKGYEIWNGAGRSAAAYVLGIQKLPVLICQDRKPGTKDKGKFEKKLITVKGVWDDQQVVAQETDEGMA